MLGTLRIPKYFEVKILLYGSELHDMQLWFDVFGPVACVLLLSPEVWIWWHLVPCFCVLCGWLAVSLALLSSFVLVVPWSVFAAAVGFVALVPLWSPVW